MESLANVLSRLQQVGAKLKKEKCKFMMSSVEGFHISGRESDQRKKSGRLF